MRVALPDRRSRSAAEETAHYVERHTGISKQLVLDLRAVDFFGGHEFTALYYISVHCARNDVDWMIIGSHPVRRLLSICDPEGELPLVDDLSSGSRDWTASRSAATITSPRLGEPTTITVG